MRSSRDEVSSLRVAREADAKKLAELVDAAYGHYVERIGKPPGPMTEDYAEVIRDRERRRPPSYAHEKMAENLALYSRVGYAEYERRASEVSHACSCGSGSVEAADEKHLIFVSSLPHPAGGASGQSNHNARARRGK